MDMEVTLRKYGNSTVAVLPPLLVRSMGLAAGQPMQIAAEDGKIVLTPKQASYKLADMLAQCDLKAAPPADLALWDSAAPVGGEAW